MNIAALLKRSQQYLSDHSPAILTGAGIAGTVVTTYLVAKASMRAGVIIKEHEEYHLETMPDSRTPVKRFTDRSKLVWKLYLPSAVSGVGTIAAIAAANRISMNRAVALSAAYTLSEKAFSEYKDKVVEKLGEKKELTMRDEIQQDRVSNNTSSNLVIVEEGEVLCFDSYSGRYFKNTMEGLKKAQNDTNYEMMNNVYVSLSEFYDKIGLPPTDFSSEVGWIGGDHKLELVFSSVIADDGRPCLAFSFDTMPVRYSYSSR